MYYAKSSKLTILPVPIILVSCLSHEINPFTIHFIIYPHSLISISFFPGGHSLTHLLSLVPLPLIEITILVHHQSLTIELVFLEISTILISIWKCLNTNTMMLVVKPGSIVVILVYKRFKFTFICELSIVERSSIIEKFCLQLPLSMLYSIKELTFIDITIFHSKEILVEL